MPENKKPMDLLAAEADTSVENAELDTQQNTSPHTTMPDFMDVASDATTQQGYREDGTFAVPRPTFEERIVIGHARFLLFGGDPVDIRTKRDHRFAASPRRHPGSRIL